MAPQLRQMNVSYVDREDRLFLRVSNSDDQEYRLWCTRRFTKLMLERFDHEFETGVAAQAPVPQEARRDVAQIQHSQTVKEESFQHAYNAEPTDFPLGEQGLLVTTLKYGKNQAGVMQLQLGNGKSKGMSLNLNEEMQHQFYELIRRAAEKADWFAPTSEAIIARGNMVH